MTLARLDVDRGRALDYERPGADAAMRGRGDHMTACCLWMAILSPLFAPPEWTWGVSVHLGKLSMIPGIPSRPNNSDSRYFEGLCANSIWPM